MTEELQEKILKYNLDDFNKRLIDLGGILEHKSVADSFLRSLINAETSVVNALTRKNRNSPSDFLANENGGFFSIVMNEDYSTIRVAPTATIARLKERRVVVIHGDSLAVALADFEREFIPHYDKFVTPSTQFFYVS